MRSLKNTLLAALLFLGNFSLASTQVDSMSSSFEALENRLQQLKKGQPKAESLHDLFALYWDWYLTENPDEATYLGYPGRHDQWPDLSLQATECHRKFSNDLLELLASFSPSDLSQEEAISAQILKRILEEDQLSIQFGSPYLLIDQMHGLHLDAVHVIEFMPARTQKEYTDILSRLRGLPLLLAQAQERLNQGLQAGITPPRIAIRMVPYQLLNLIVEEPRESFFLKAFQQFPPSFDEATRHLLQKEADQIYQKEIVPALKAFYTYITDSYLPQCRTTIAMSDLPNGKEWYAHKIRQKTTTRLTPEEIHAIGCKEVERIHQAMLQVMENTPFKGNFEAFLHFLKTDRQFFYPNREELLAGYRALTKSIQTKLPLLFSDAPPLPFEVIPVPSYSEEAQTGAYYCHGSKEHNRPGRFFINTNRPEERPKWEMIPLALHEAVPGHHLQISLAQELTHLPEFRKSGHFTAYIEGWGLYAESLGSEFGLYQDPYSQFGKLSFEMLRAIRLVVDTGMHAMGWTRQEAIDYFKRYVGMSDHEIMAEVDRYLVMPGQALAYKIGELKIQDMRQLAKEKLGEQFSIQAFHHAWLENGTVPLDIAEQHIHEWIHQLLIERSQPK